MNIAADQDAAYEAAVRAVQTDPDYRDLLERAFLHADLGEALEAFEASEDWARVRRLIARMGVPAGARVLDFGGGRGLLAAALAHAGYDVVLCEPNPSEVCGAGAASRLAAIAPRPFEIFAGMSGDLAPRSFDAVVCRAVLHHLEPLEQILREVRLALRVGGAFVASDEPTIRRASDLAAAHARHPFIRFGVQEEAHTPAHYEQALLAAGFTDVNVVFPVALEDYRRLVRSDLAGPVAAAAYARYRLRGTLRPKPGDVRSITARAPR